VLPCVFLGLILIGAGLYLYLLTYRYRPEVARRGSIQALSGAERDRLADLEDARGDHQGVPRPRTGEK
jgi:hypothetical protein